MLKFWETTTFLGKYRFLLKIIIQKIERKSQQVSSTLEHRLSQNKHFGQYDPPPRTMRNRVELKYYKRKEKNS